MASDPVLVGVVWWPHSGGRWFCRSILKKHSRIHETAFTHPWLFFSSDMTLDLDITEQVHKARSLPEWKEHLNALWYSTETGRKAGLKAYFDHIKAHYIEPESPNTHIVGEMCLGSPIPRSIDLKTLFEACPDIHIIHLIRDPRDNFDSFAVRHELDGDPVKAAGSWLTLNAGIRKFFENRPHLNSQYLQVRYEDLLEDPKEAMKKVFGFMGLEYEENTTEELQERWGRGTKAEEAKVHNKENKVMNELIGDELERFGYKL